MVDDGGRLISQLFAGIQQTLGKLHILSSNLTAWSRTEIGAKPTVLIKYVPAKSHVCAIRRAGEWPNLRTQVECYE